MNGFGALTSWLLVVSLLNPVAWCCGRGWERDELVRLQHQCLSGTCCIRPGVTAEPEAAPSCCQSQTESNSGALCGSCVSPVAACPGPLNSCAAHGSAKEVPPTSCDTCICCATETLPPALPVVPPPVTPSRSDHSATPPGGAIIPIAANLTGCDLAAVELANLHPPDHGLRQARLCVWRK